MTSETSDITNTDVTEVTVGCLPIVLAALAAWSIIITAVVLITLAIAR